MSLYNKIMLYFWLFTSIFLFLAVTYMGFMYGFEIWAYYYIFVGLTLIMYFFRKWMMKRMDKHMEYLQNKANEDTK